MNKSDIEEFENLSPLKLRQLQDCFSCGVSHQISEMWLDGVENSSYKLTAEIIDAVNIIKQLPQRPDSEKLVHIFGSPYSHDKVQQLLGKYGIFGQCVMREKYLIFLPLEEDDEDKHVNLDYVLMITHAESVDFA